MGAQPIERRPGGFLLGVLFGAPSTFGQHVRTQPHLDVKPLVVIRPRRPRQHILGKRPILRLEQLLKRRLEVAQEFGRAHTGDLVG